MTADQLFDSIKKQLISQLDEIADNLIAEKTLEFQRDLESKRSEVIAGILDSIEIMMCENQIEDRVNLTLMYSPRIRKE